MTTTCSKSTLTRTCPYCGRALQTLSAALAEEVPDDIAALPIACDCPESEEADKAATEEQERKKRDAEEGKRHAASGMPDYYRAFRFGKNCMPRSDLRPAYASAWQWCKDAIHHKEHSPMLYIAGNLGTGKTCLAASCVNSFIRAGRWVTWRRYGDLLRDIKDCYSDKSTTAERALIDRYGKQIDILVIDDLGKDKASEWAVSRIFDIIDARYSARKKTIITTNYGGNALIDRLTPRDRSGNALDDVTPAAIVDRLREISQAIKLTGASLRTNQPK